MKYIITKKKEIIKNHETFHVYNKMSRSLNKSINSIKQKVEKWDYYIIYYSMANGIFIIWEIYYKYKKI